MDSGGGYLEAVAPGLDRKVHILAVIPNHGIIVLAQTETEAVGKEPDSGRNIPIGEIKLYSSCLYVDFKESTKFGEEICRRFNEFSQDQKL